MNYLVFDFENIDWFRVHLPMLAQTEGWRLVQLIHRPRWFFPDRWLAVLER